MFVVVGLLVAGVVGVLLYWSYPGQPAPFVGHDGQPLPGSISEKVWVEINGVPQGMFIRGRNATKPVLLFLHGGMPEYFLAERAPRGLEGLFVVGWWEQRGAGLSYRPDHQGERITTAQLAADAIAVARYLRGRSTRSAST
jgi:pimeloyl-ACP methyl ester carboxylesterase